MFSGYWLTEVTLAADFCLSVLTVLKLAGSVERGK
jgi:hypothetical protein